MEDGVWAEVRAHGQVTRYRSSGSGRTVLCLGFDDAAEPVLRALLDSLRARYRLILPELPAGTGDPASWLAHFLEGFGCPNVRVVAAGKLCMPALELALLEPERVGRVALLPAGSGGTAGLGGALETNVPRGRVPLLIVRGGSEAELLARVNGFLDADGVASVA